MKAILLCAGYAKRMWPLTKDTPKPLLTINDKPLISYLVENLEQTGMVDQIYVISNDRFYDHFVRWQTELKTDIPIEIINDGTRTEETRLGAIGDINYVIEKKDIREDLMVLAGDILFDFSLTPFIQYFQEKRSTIAIVNKAKNEFDAKKSGNAVLDTKSKIISFAEKPQVPISDILVRSIYIYKKEDVKKIKEYLKSGNNPDAPGHFIDWLHKKTSVYGYTAPGPMHDIGFVEGYHETDRLFRDKPEVVK